MANSVFFFSKFNRQPFDRTFFAFEILLSRDPCDGLSFYKCSAEGISTFLLLIFLAYFVSPSRYLPDVMKIFTVAI